jgi:hypothetical protein
MYMYVYVECMVRIYFSWGGGEVNYSQMMNYFFKMKRNYCFLLAKSYFF